MALDREFKQFFLRDEQESGGLYPDQEVGFPIEYQVNIPGGGTITVKNRYLTTHYPSQDVFEKLFNSLAFQLNSEDTATESYQGLVKRGTQAQFDNGDTLDDDGFFLVYPQSMYSTLIDSSGVIEDIKFNESTRIITVDFLSSPDLLIDTHTTFLYGDYGSTSGVTGGKTLDYAIDKKSNNSLYHLSAEGWIDTGVDLLGSVSLDVTGNSYQLQQKINGTTFDIGEPWISSDEGQALYTDNGDGTITLSWTGSTPDTITFDKNTEVVPLVTANGTELYNDYIDPTNLIAIIPNESTSSSEVIFGTEDDPNLAEGGIGSDNDVYINTDTGEIWQNDVGTWNLKTCFSKCGGSGTYPSTPNSFKLNMVSNTVVESSDTDPINLYDNITDAYDISDIWTNSQPYGLFVQAGLSLSISAIGTIEIHNEQASVTRSLKIMFQKDSSGGVELDFPYTSDASGFAEINITGLIAVASEVTDESYRFEMYNTGDGDILVKDLYFRNDG